MNVFRNNKRYSKFRYSNEAEFEADIVENSTIFFGDKTIYIDAKKKIDSKSLEYPPPVYYRLIRSNLNYDEYFFNQLLRIRLNKDL